MSKTIHKYALFSTLVELHIPADAQVLCVHTQRRQVQIWLLLDKDAPTVPRRFAAYATGADVPDNPGTYIGTVFLADDALVYHVFEVTQVVTESSDHVASGS